MLYDIMLTGKVIFRAVRGHILIDAALTTNLVAKAYHIPLPTKEDIFAQTGLNKY